MKTNKNKLIGIIADETVDVNMLVWSLYKLTQQPQYYYVGFEYWFDITDAVPEEVDGGIDIKVEVDGVESIDELNDKVKQFDALTGPAGVHVLTTKLHEIQTNPELYSALVDACDNVIVISSFGEPTIYKVLNSGGTIDNFLVDFFEEGKDNWEDVYGLPWDRREYIALNFRPKTVISVDDKLDLSSDKIYQLSYAEYYLNLQQHLLPLCKFIGISLEEFPESAHEEISEIYKKWKNFHSNPIFWDLSLPRIVHNIVNGYSMDLTPYRLDIIKEAIILHELLYKHGKNIKSFGLNTFPANTKDIHALLEDNFHTLSAY